VKVQQGTLLVCVTVCLPLFLAAILRWPDSAGAADYKAGTPYTYLFDTGPKVPVALAADALTARTGWTLLEEDDTTHKFQGDAVLVNEKLAVRLRSREPRAEVYSQTAGGLKLRAVVVPLSTPGTPVVGISSLAIVENSRSAVAVKAMLRTAAGERIAVRYNLATGQRILELVAGEAAGRLSVQAEIRHVVVPDFFADDMVFGPRAFTRDYLRLPTENMLLGLLDGGDAMLMCMWRSPRQGAIAAIAAQEKPLIHRCEIECAKDTSLWIAFLETPRIWHERTISAADAKQQIAPDWQPPFAARWRADLVQPDGAAESWDFAAAGVAPKGKPGTLVVYPLDRSRATPLAAFCPTDMLRNTLGIGPCQYILQTEGLATETNPTPDQVMNFVEKQFERKKEQKSAEEIKNLLQQMVEQVRRTQARIEQYAKFAQKVRELIASGQPKPPAARSAEVFESTIAEMETALAACRGTNEPVRQAANLAGRVAGLIGKENALPECQKLGAELRRLGAVQDRGLSKCRMGVRWLRQQAAMLSDGESDSTPAARIASAAANFLENK